MNDEATGAPIVSTPIPILRSFDETKTKEFYVSFLGFTIDWEHRFTDSSPLYMQVSIGPCKIQISEHFGDGTPGAKIKIETRNLDAYQKQLLAKQYRHSRPGITEHDWGERSMAINDPTGNTVIFFENIAKTASSS